jgi:hypothetical protein
MISLDLSKCYGFKKHRSGWGHCIDSLKPYHSKSGIFFDGFLEHNFSWHIQKYLHEGFEEIPYTFPWVGVLTILQIHQIGMTYTILPQLCLAGMYFCTLLGSAKL